MVGGEVPVNEFLDLATNQNPGFLRSQVRPWHFSPLPTGDTLVILGMGPEMVVCEAETGEALLQNGPGSLKTRDTGPPPPKKLADPRLDVAAAAAGPVAAPPLQSYQSKSGSRDKRR